MRRSIVATALVAIAFAAPATADAARVQVQDGTLVVDVKEHPRALVTITGITPDYYRVGFNADYCGVCTPIEPEMGAGCSPGRWKGVVICRNAVDAEIWMPLAGGALSSETTMLMHTVHGGPGPDAVSLLNFARDVIDLGAGDDWADLGQNLTDYRTSSDLIDLGPGRDRVMTSDSGFGVEVRAADGERDEIECRGVANRVVHDQLDAVQRCDLAQSQYVEPPAQSEPADTTAPTVVETRPADGATDVALTTEVAVRFSEPMDAASSEQAFSLRRESDGAAVPGSFSWTGETLTFQPARPLAKRAAYRFTVDGGATDVAGNRLGTTVTGRFQTARR